MLKIDGVFAGGGIKAFSFIGAMQILDQEGITFERLAGTSAGSIVAAFIKVGFNSEEMASMFDELNLERLLDTKKRRVRFPFYRWLRLYRQMGLYKGDNFEQWLVEMLKVKGVSTFGDLPLNSLKMIASDITNGQILIIPDDLPRYGIIPEKFSVAKAIRMSCSLPFFFEPVTLTNNNGKHAIIVDGGVLSNFPIWLFMKQNEKKLQRPVLGFRLSTTTETVNPREIKNAFTMVHSMVETMWKAHDQRYISKLHAKNIVFIPAEDISPTQFAITDADKEKLIQLGKKTTKSFLKEWTY